MLEAAGGDKARPGIVAVPQTFGSLIQPHPHLHALASRGLWDNQGQWLPVPYVDTIAAEKLFAHKILHLLKSKGLLSDERIELLSCSVMATSAVSQVMNSPILSRIRLRYQHIPFPALPRLCYFPDVPRPKRSRGRELSSFCSRGHSQISYRSIDSRR